MKLNFWAKGTPAPYVEDKLNTKELLVANEDDGTMPDNVEALRQAVVGHRIVNAEKGPVPDIRYAHRTTRPGFVITLDNGKKVILADTDDCCAYTELDAFLLNPESVEHIIMGVGTTEAYTTWHIYADYGDILNLQVGWCSGNPFYYGYGFDITVEDIPKIKA